MSAAEPGSAPGGLLIVDKPAGMTSHDVVARIRRLAGTRRVGHAGTLDPMATGVLVIGLDKATRLLGHLTLADKEYQATIRLGQATDTGDAEGTVTGGAPASGLPPAAVRAAAAALTGPIEQVPPAVSAIKVAGRRSYQLAREGAPPVHKPRPVTIWSFTVGDLRPAGDLLDVDAEVRCSSGTYIRALARD
ncbi:MAG: tRNA pseudouridine(55) synthase TruB, partial [Streptosporangiales bacterium]